MGLRYVVITSVTRDDLPDGGASVFCDTIREVRKALPAAGIEVLVPDFLGRSDAVRAVATAGPDVFNHNLETVPRLYPTVRPGADYRRSLDVIGAARAASPGLVTKSGIMLGLGETGDEVRAVLEDLLAAGCSVLTLGQYLQPTPGHLPVAAFVPPEAFEAWAETARAMGFSDVASGPLVRSSYQADALFRTCRCGGDPP
jgi:lipoic acid synthetase